MNNGATLEAGITSCNPITNSNPVSEHSNLFTPLNIHFHDESDASLARLKSIAMVGPDLSSQNAIRSSLKMDVRVLHFSDNTIFPSSASPSNYFSYCARRASSCRISARVIDAACQWRSFSGRHYQVRRIRRISSLQSCLRD
jgi:hypothetical protein